MGKYSRTMGRVASVALALAAMRSAQGSFIVDFRFSANPADTVMTVAGGENVTVQVWGKVIGTGGLGIGSTLLRAVSKQYSGGAFTSGGVSAGFVASANFNNSAVAGSLSDVSSPADGLQDLGQGVGAVGNAPPDAKARATLVPNSATVPGYYVSQGGWTPISGGAAIELGSFTVHVGTLSAGVTKFIPVPSNGPSNSTTWFENATTLNGVSGLRTAGGFSTGTSVAFVTSNSGPVPPVNFFTVKYAFTTHNNATLGYTFNSTFGTFNTRLLSVVGNHGQYFDPGPDSSYTPANSSILGDYTIVNGNLGVGTEVPVLVMVDFDFGSSGLTVADLKANFQSVGDVAATLVGPGDADPLNQRNLLLGQYPSFNSSTTLLFEFMTAPGAVSNGLHFGYDLSGSGVSVLRTIVVPEPASAVLLASGSAALLRRRRRGCQP